MWWVSGLIKPIVLRTFLFWTWGVESIHDLNSCLDIQTTTIFTTRPTAGFLIQFIIGHGWFGQHRSKFNEDFSVECRFCNSAGEDPDHSWSSCMNFNGVRHAIRHLYKDDKSSVSFDKPYVWSVTQLVQFFGDNKMDQLFTDPGTQQQASYLYEVVALIQDGGLA